jgi:hypothetical protein
MSYITRYMPGTTYPPGQIDWSNPPVRVTPETATIPELMEFVLLRLAFLKMSVRHYNRKIARAA